MASAWVTREWMDGKNRCRKRAANGMKGVSGKDRFVVEWTEPDGQRRREKIPATGRVAKRLADQLVRKINSELTLGTYDRNRRQPWLEFRVEFERLVLPAKRPATQRLTRDTLDLFERLCHPRYVEEIRTRTIDRFKSMLGIRRGRNPGSTLSPCTVNRHLRHLKAVLNKAVKWEALSKLPEFAFLDEPEKETVYLPPDEFGRIYVACDDAKYPVGRAYNQSEWWRALIVSGYMTAMRITEMLTLPWEDVHLDDAFLVVRHRHTKGKRDDLIPLHPVVVEHLRPITDYGALVFDWPMSRTTLWAEWARIQRAAGVHRPCREDHVHTPRCHVYGFHSLKKACGTLNATLLPKAVLNAFMRHRSFATTEKYYLNRDALAKGVTDQMFVPDVLRTDS